MDDLYYPDAIQDMSSAAPVAPPFLLPPKPRRVRQLKWDTSPSRWQVADQISGGTVEAAISPEQVRQFNTLADKWKEETVFMSSINDMAMNRYYQRIIGMGLSVVPLILERLKTESDFWFWALEAITGDDPIPASAYGNVQRMSAAWLKWGRQKGYSV